MSTSPFMTPDQSRRRRDLARQRRRRRRAIGLGTLLVVILAALAVTIGLSKSGSHGSAAASTRQQTKRPRAPAVPKPTRSAIGLPLGRAPLVLKGLGSPQQDAVRIAFHSPPRAGLLFNLKTGQVLWQRNPYIRLRVASLTKMMTALLSVKSGPADAPVLVTRQAINTAGSKVGVLPLGKHVRLESMLYGLLLPSGNDAAVALAQHVAGSLARFVRQMNDEAAALGMGCTRYSSSSGYVNSGNFSCAADLAVLAHVDLQQPRLASIVRTYSAELPFPIKGGKLFLYNNNPLLIYHYPGLTGLKTGFTDAAGKCLVATAERDGVRLGVVVLHSPNPGTQARQLLNRGFERVYRQAPIREPPVPAGA
jgi:serine-type D-Ala-D-Ala carboxypeptidase (penicillin-binding protein 5/6)